MTDAQTPTRVIFLSAVSNEFHNVPAEQRHLFHSYRNVLKQAFDTLARGQYEVIVQEDLVQGFRDLLETLEDAIARSLFVVHLVGDLAGFLPEPAALRRLHERHPDLLGKAPELNAAIGDGLDITYTQWELYLAFHHDKGRLVFDAHRNAPRSPLFAPTPTDTSSQAAHRRRIEITGQHRGTFLDQNDVARQAIRSFLHDYPDPIVDPVTPSAEDLAEAWKHQKEIVGQLADAIKKPDPRAVPAPDPANAAAFVAAVRAAAERWRVNLTTIVNIAARYRDDIHTAAGDEPTFESLYDEAFAHLALGDYTASAFYARHAADLALKHLQQQPEFDHIHREDAGDALLLLAEAAKAARDIPAAIAALEEAGSLIDKKKDPLRWADVHEHLADFLLDHAQWDRADEFISELIDVREEHQGENHPALANTLLLWANLLSAQANYPAMESVAARAERIFAGQTPINLTGIAVAISQRASALKEQGRMGEAEPLMRRALLMDEQSYEAEPPTVAARLSNLAQLLEATNRMKEAEPLLRRALLIDEQHYGAGHPMVGKSLNNLAVLLLQTDQLAEAEPLMRRALWIDEQCYGADHPNVAIRMGNLAQLLEVTNRMGEAEPLLRRALSIHEQSYGAEHPMVAIGLNNLAALLLKTNQPAAEAEPLMRRALWIDEQCYGAGHPNVAIDLHNLAQLLMSTDRLTESEPLMRRALEILEANFGPDHPQVAMVLVNLAYLLRSTGRLAEAEPLSRRTLEIFAGFTMVTGHMHPQLQTAIGRYSDLLRQMGRSEQEIRSHLDELGESLRSSIRRGED